jgi:hypothetical protein
MLTEKGAGPFDPLLQGAPENVVKFNNRRRRKPEPSPL